MPADAAVSLGVGGNEEKRIGGAFEEEGESQRAGGEAIQNAMFHCPSLGWGKIRILKKKRRAVDFLGDRQGFLEPS